MSTMNVIQYTYVSCRNISVYFNIFEEPIYTFIKERCFSRYFVNTVYFFREVQKRINCKVENILNFRFSSPSLQIISSILLTLLHLLLSSSFSLSLSNLFLLLCFTAFPLSFSMSFHSFLSSSFPLSCLLFLIRLSFLCFLQVFFISFYRSSFSSPFRSLLFSLFPHFHIWYC